MYNVIKEEWADKCAVVVVVCMWAVLGPISVSTILSESSIKHTTDNGDVLFPLTACFAFLWFDFSFFFFFFSQIKYAFLIYYLCVQQSATDFMPPNISQLNFYNHFSWTELIGALEVIGLHIYFCVYLYSKKRCHY